VVDALDRGGLRCSVFELAAFGANARFHRRRHQDFRSGSETLCSSESSRAAPSFCNSRHRRSSQSCDRNRPTIVSSLPNGCGSVIENQPILTTGRNHKTHIHQHGPESSTLTALSVRIPFSGSIRIARSGFAEAAMQNRKTHNTKPRFEDGVGNGNQTGPRSNH